MSDSARAQQAQHQENLEELFALVYQDDLTGLHNRRFFSRKLVAPLDQTPGESPYVFLLVDIDHFKEINDTHGHAAGDKALTCLADMLRGWVKGDEQALRYAGDEFLLFLPGADPASGMRRAEDLVQMARLLRVPVNGGDESFGLTLSVGTACRPENGKGWEDVLEKADEALYAVKQRGRDGASLPPEEGAIFRGDDLSRIFPCPRFVAPEILLQPILGEIADWREAAADAEPNRAASLFRVSGGRGSGKTRLLAELAKNAGSRGYAVLRIHGSEQMHRLPYGCLTGGLLAATETSEELREAALPYWSREDAALWEIFFAAEPGARRSLDQDTVNRFYAGLLLGFAGGRDLLLLADDAERLDPETRGMLEDSPDFRPPSLRMFSVLVANTPVPPPPQSGTGDAEPTAPPPAQEAVAGQSTVGLDLPPLVESQVQEMLRAILPTLRTEFPLASELHRRSGGNPLYVEEALKFLIQDGRLVYQRSAWQWTGDSIEDLPATLEALMTARLDALDPEVRGFLETASLLGPDFDPEILQKTHGTNQGHLQDLLEKARRFGIMEIDSQHETERLRFHSQTAQQVSYDQVPERDRAGRHLLVAEVRETLDRNRNPIDLAPLLYHYEMAGETGKLKEIGNRLAGMAALSRFQLAAPFAARKHKSPFPECETLDPPAWPRVLAVFHLLRAAVQTARLYPDTSQAVSKSCERLLEGFEQVFQHVSCLHLSEVDGALLANGEAPSWKGEEKRAADAFSRSLTEAGLKALSFRKGLSRSEMKEFLGFWLSILNRSLEPLRAWEAFEQQDGIENIRINAKVYVAVSETDLAGSGLQEGGGDQHRDSLDELAALLSSLQARIAAFRDLPAGEARNGPETLDFIEQLERIRGSFLAGEGGSAVVLPPAGEVPDKPSAGNGPAADPPSLPNLEMNPEEDARCSLADILSGDPQRESRGYATVSRLGERAPPVLYFHLCQTEDAHAGRVCARLLKTLDPRFESRVREDLERNAEPSVKLRILRHALPVLEDREEKRRLLVGILEQEDGPAALEALQQLETELPEQLTSLLLRILPSRTNRQANEICAALGRLGDSACVEPLLGYLSRWKSLVNGKSAGFLESVCHALGHYQHPGVVERLGSLLAPPSRLPWRRRVPPPLRKAALQALERIGGEAAAATVMRCEADADPWIRYRAKNFRRQPAGPARAGRPGDRSAPA